MAGITTRQLHFYQAVKLITCGKCVRGTSGDGCQHLLTALKRGLGYGRNQGTVVCRGITHLVSYKSL